MKVIILRKVQAYWSDNKLLGKVKDTKLISVDSLTERDYNHIARYEKPLNDKVNLSEEQYLKIEVIGSLTIFAPARNN